MQVKAGAEHAEGKVRFANEFALYLVSNGEK